MAGSGFRVEPLDTAALLFILSSRRAHLGLRSGVGKMQAIPAWRQFEQGDSLSHRTFLCRHVTQLRRFGGGAVEAGLPEAGEGAWFSEATSVNDPGVPCDILHSEQRASFTKV